MGAGFISALGAANVADQTASDVANQAVTDAANQESQRANLVASIHKAEHDTALKIIGDISG